VVNSAHIVFMVASPSESDVSLHVVITVLYSVFNMRRGVKSLSLNIQDFTSFRLGNQGRFQQARTLKMYTGEPTNLNFSHVLFRNISVNLTYTAKILSQGRQ
jgi:hypothetical protein